MTEERESDNWDRLGADLQHEIDEKEWAHYSAKVLEHARNPTNQGRMQAPDAHAVFTGWCGDTMEIYLRLSGGAIQEARFMTDGCGTSVAGGNMLTTMVLGLALDEASRIEPQDLLLALDGLPEESAHCAELAVKTLRQAIANARRADTTGIA